ncbi:MAG: type II toxin-antitoxin system Phd/YefM family antitoxin [Solirubrobacterales bacterium]|nr:type II toxin-antitoxin system Phd/YefM family antitoxin [Solirubrobacterales bacterium]
MDEMALSQARESLADVVNRIRFGGERVALTRHGRPVAALVPVADAELLERLEDEADLDAARAALAEGGAPIPWDDLKSELGL